MVTEQRLLVRVKAGASRDLVVPGEEHYTVYTRAVARQGLANRAVCQLLATHFGVALGQVEIRFGKSAREKLVVVRVE